MVVCNGLSTSSPTLADGFVIKINFMNWMLVSLGKFHLHMYTWHLLQNFLRLLPFQWQDWCTLLCSLHLEMSHKASRVEQGEDFLNVLLFGTYKQRICLLSCDLRVSHQTLGDWADGTAISLQQLLGVLDVLPQCNMCLLTHCGIVASSVPHKAMMSDQCSLITLVHNPKKLFG